MKKNVMDVNWDWIQILVGDRGGGGGVRGQEEEGQGRRGGGGGGFLPDRQNPASHPPVAWSTLSAGGHLP